MKVGVITSDPSGAVSFYRVYGPFIELEKKRPDIKFIDVSTVGWKTFQGLDILFMHRCTTKSDIEVMNMAKIAGIKIILDYDDNFLAIPADNPAYEQYASIPNLKENLEKILSLTDVVTCTTESMQAALHKLCDKYVRVVPNALNTNFVAREVKERAKVILWRGSKTHVADLMSGKRMVESMVLNYPEYEWVFIGQNPWMYEGIIEKFHYLPGMEPYKYFQLIKGIAPEFMFVPLVDNDFNRAKSNIAWLEGTWAGAKTIASELPEFTKPGVGIFADQKLHVQPNVETSWDYIQGELTLDKVNLSREHILDTLYLEK